LIEKRNIKIKVTGIRPGEKMHEIMVSEEEANHCIKRGDYYAILPMLPELRDKNEKAINALKKEFSSADNVLNFKDTISLLKKHNLMIGESIPQEDGELLR